MAPEMAYSYAKHAQYGHGMKRQTQGSHKISTFPVYSMAKQWTKTGQNKHAKMGNKHEIKKQLIATVLEQVRALLQY